MKGNFFLSLIKNFAFGFPLSYGILAYKPSFNNRKLFMLVIVFVHYKGFIAIAIALAMYCFTFLIYMYKEQYTLL